MMPMIKSPNSSPLPQAYLHPTSKNPDEALLEASELSSYLLARAYFDTHEYDRASFVLAKCKSGKSRFLHLYAKYMAGEKRKDEDSEMVLGPLDGSVTQNKECPSILTALEAILAEKEDDLSEDDSWLLFLYGIVLAKQKNDTEARDALIQSVNLYPYNWSAWQELGATIANLTDVCNSSFP
jgi:anaphase-promoting complex subunit 8